MKINILYEDDFLLALDKPSGVMVHADGRNNTETLVDWVRANYPALEEVGEMQTLQNGEIIKRPGIVHRLDRETSGVILVAKTAEAFAYLKDQFQNRKVEKIYHTVVWGHFSPDKMVGVIDKPIGRSASDFRKWSAEFGAKGELREAVTEYKVLGSIPHPAPIGIGVDPLLLQEREEEKNNNIDSSISYLEVRPKTGRTHQIRVHLKSISHPVVGDKLYGPNNPPNPLYLKGGTNHPIFDRLALRAFSIKLELPNHTFITIESPLPEEFEETRSLLKVE